MPTMDLVSLFWLWLQCGIQGMCRNKSQLLVNFLSRSFGSFDYNMPDISYNINTILMFMKENEEYKCPGCSGFRLYLPLKEDDT